ncbi:hypothetical protein C8R44DRAFT_725463 [Mycena epipterygia]|nr:hypothetical protein C8R44DRAFT_725463 [Mycena epipterygia]
MLTTYCSIDYANVTPSLQDTRKGCLVHNKPLEYYPPHAERAEDFEPAARGYSGRSDSYNQDRHSVADIIKMMETTAPTAKNHNISTTLAADVRRTGADAGDLIEKYAADRAVLPRQDVPVRAQSKAPAPSSKWYRQHEAMREAYKNTVWAPKLVNAWDMGFQNTVYPRVHDIELTPKCKDMLLFTAPQPHLFMNKGEEKEHCMLFVWTCIRRAWLSRIDRDVDCTEVVSWGLTTQQWREILGGKYWKLKHPKEEGGKSTFDWRKFWRHGGEMVLGHEHEDWASVDLSPKIAGSSTGRLELEDFGDNDLKAPVIWDLGLCHAQLQLDRADEILYAQPSLRDHPIRLNTRRARRRGILHEADWVIPTLTPPWERSLADPKKRRWIACFLEVIIHWPCASQMDWFFAEQGLDRVVPGEGETALGVFCQKLSDGKLYTLENSAVAVYYQGIFDALGVLATGVTKRPHFSTSVLRFLVI